MNFEVAVPSYRRAEKCAGSTLTYLAECGVPSRRITVFVASEEEKKEYRRTLRANTYGELVVGVPGMGAIRNFIQRHYSVGQKILHVDDDIDGLYTHFGKKQLCRFLDLKEFAEAAFNLCEQRKIRLWGVYPVLNPYFMKTQVTFDLRYIIGCFWGSTNSHDDVLTVSLDDKEDFERTIKCYLADGSVARFEHLAPKTNYYKEPGGMQIERTAARIRESAELLVQRYPHLCQLNLSKKSGHAEVRLRDRRQRAKA